MRFLEPDEVLELHRRLVRPSCRAEQLRDQAALLSAVAEPRRVVDGLELYRTTVDKAAALCFAVMTNRPFIHGNDRVGHAATEVFLRLNGHEIWASIDEQEQILRDLTAGRLSRDQRSQWLRGHITPLFSAELLEAVNRSFSQADRRTVLDVLSSVQSEAGRKAIVILAFGNPAPIKELADTAIDDWRNMSISISQLPQPELLRRCSELGLRDSRPETANEVKRFIAYHLIIPFDQIYGSLRLQDQLDLAGRDGAQLMESFAKKFYVDMTDFKASDYFPCDEPSEFVSGLAKLLGKSKRTICSLTVDGLIVAAQTGKFKRPTGEQVW